MGARELVLRKKPPGKLLASAHAVEREYTVMKALMGSGVPVPGMRCLCTDTAVLGTPFYVMDYVQGRLFLEPGMPGLQGPQRAHVFRLLGGTRLARLLWPTHHPGPAPMSRVTRLTCRYRCWWNGSRIALLCSPSRPLHRCPVYHLCVSPVCITCVYHL